MVTAETHATIRTPDQRIRVFVSSTLRELADERRAVRAAIERMQLAPVMFELGARPHPPRALYRSYLAQSDVFVGIYGDSYGWVAPEEQISGLEDEYDLAPRSMPKLIYIKKSDHPRGSPQGAHRADPDRRHRRVPSVRDRRRTGEPGGGPTSPPCWPSASRSRARTPGRPTRMPLRHSSRGCRSRTRPRSAASARSPTCGNCSRAAATGWSA